MNDVEDKIGIDLMLKDLQEVSESIDRTIFDCCEVIGGERYIAIPLLYNELTRLNGIAHSADILYREPRPTKCIECEHWECLDEGSIGRCDWWHHATAHYDFCSYAWPIKGEDDE